MQKIVLSLVATLCLAACAGAATNPPTQQLEGEIQIKGNEPFPTVMLETAGHDTWELVGMPMDEARALAGRRVKVQGTVIRAPGPGVFLPSVRVIGKPGTPAP
jgi:hypothetical protein